MFNLLFDKNFLITILIIVAVALVLIALIKYEHARPILVTLLCVAWLGVGCYCGANCYVYYRTLALEKVSGAPVVHDPYEDFNFFEYDLGKIVWYQDEEGNYSYETTYATAIKFDGNENKYQLLVNNTPCQTTTANAKLHATLQKEFIDVDGNLTDTINFTIDFTFSSSNITVRVENDATTENIGLVREYVNVNGFNLRIINAVYSATA